MKCPRCNIELTAERHFDIPISRCASCGGILLERGQAEAIDELDIGPAIEGAESGGGEAAKPAVKEAHCYECDLPMLELTGAGDVEFDWCSGCERIFFDRGELSAFDAAQGD